MLKVLAILHGNYWGLLSIPGISSLTYVINRATAGEPSGPLNHPGLCPPSSSQDQTSSELTFFHKVTLHTL